MTKYKYFKSKNYRANVNLVTESDIVEINDQTSEGGGIPEAPNDGELYGRKNEAWEVVPSGGGGATWGGITGTLSDQTDLQGALDAKENTSNKATNLTSPDDTKYPTTQAVVNALSDASSVGSDIFLFQYY